MMRNISRRQFIAGIAGATALPLFARGAPEDEQFEMLVIGDSLIWGQGLSEEQKTYQILRRHIESEVLGSPVALKVLAHSGATLKLSRAENAALKRAEVDLDGFHPEMNISFPTVMDQLDAAVKYYGDVERVRLVLLSCGVPDIGVINILNPFGDDDELREEIRTVIGGRINEVIDRTARSFPNAVIGVLGYYPIITRFTPMSKIINDVLEVYDWPGWTKPLVNNRLNRLWLRRFRRRMIERSRIWLEESTRVLAGAVDTVNGYTGNRTVFVPPPFDEEHGYGAPETRLWNAGGGAKDPRADDRRSACETELVELRDATGLSYRTRVCELASIGHPNLEGAAAIATALEQALVPRISLR